MNYVPKAIQFPAQSINASQGSQGSIMFTNQEESQTTRFQIMVHDQRRSQSNWNPGEFQLARSTAKFNGNDGMIWRPVQPSNKNGLSGEGNLRTTRKEWRPKALSSTITSDVIHSRLEKCPEDLQLSEKQHVIIPNHLLSPKLETAGLTFGSFDSGFKRVFLANGTDSEVGYKPHGTSDWRLSFDSNSYQPSKTHGTSFKPLTATAIDRNDSPTAHGDGHYLFQLPGQNIALLPVYRGVLSPQEKKKTVQRNVYSDFGQPTGGLISNATIGNNNLTGNNVPDFTLGLMENKDHTI